jgi:hypothetical protein
VTSTTVSCNGIVIPSSPFGCQLREAGDELPQQFGHVLGA